ncbi:MAG: hypothetical protein ACT4NY_24105 [Pseudonocardiales bacterium]
MAMAQVMSGMPDVWQRVLAEHIPDQGGRCQACREGGFSASWPCLTRQIAEQAKRIHDDPQPEFPPLRPVSWTPEPSPLQPVEWSPEPAPIHPMEWSSESSPLQAVAWSPEPSPIRSTGRHAAR